MNIPYGDWRNTVDECLFQIYCIGIEDAGLDEPYLTDHWRSNTAPRVFVEWFRNKIDRSKGSIEFKHQNICGASQTRSPDNQGVFAGGELPECNHCCDRSLPVP